MRRSLSSNSFFSQAKAANSHATLPQKEELAEELRKMTESALEMSSNQEKTDHQRSKDDMSSISEQVTRFGIFSGGGATITQRETPTLTR